VAATIVWIKCGKSLDYFLDAAGFMKKLHGSGCKVKGIGDKIKKKKNNIHQEITNIEAMTRVGNLG